LENRIAQLRKERHISQAELAEALEVTRQTVNSLEGGRFNASLALAHRIARYFGLTIEEVFLFEETAVQESPEALSPKASKEKVTITPEQFKSGHWRNPYADEVDALIHGEL